MVRGCLPANFILLLSFGSESVSAKGAGDGARCACVEEQVNFSTARDTVLSSPHITHPIVVDQYDLCALV